MIKFFIENKYKILFAILGLGLTILSFVLYENNKEKNWLTVILSLSCFVLGAIQVYALYISQKEFDLLSNLLLSIIAVALFIIVVFTLVTLVCIVMVKIPFSFDFLLYAIFLLPSFVVVIMIVILLLMILSYA